MDAPLPGSGPEIDPNEPVPDDPAELLPDAPEPRGGTFFANSTGVFRHDHGPTDPIDAGSVPVREAARGYGNADNASVNNATSASCCTSADDNTSSSEPSSALAASPALLSISSAILASMVCAAMMRHAVTGSS
jgi:hypothetical protein